LVLLVTSLSACNGVLRPSPSAAYDEILWKVRHGDLDVALRDAQGARQRYAANSIEWEWRFRTLQGLILVSRNQYKAALALLDGPFPPQLKASPVEAHKEMVEGIAYRYAQEFADSEKHLDIAEQLASRQPDLLCQIWNAQGGLVFDQSKYAKAEALFRRALSAAREHHLPWHEASALTNLGLVATSQERFDEGVDWDQSALKLSQALGMRGTTSTILGNLGWGYKQLGDFENALSYYRQAEDAATRSGLLGNRVYWLTGISNVYYLQHDYVSAEAVLKQALDLARRQDEKSTLTEFLNDLSEIAIETGQVDVAEQYYGEASEIERSGLDQSGVLESTLVRGRIDESKRDYAHAEESFQRVIRDPKSGTPQRWEAEARLAKVYEDEGLAAKAEKEFRRSLETIEAARSSVQAEDLRMSFLSGAISFYNDYIEFLILHHRIEDALQMAELSRARTLAEGLGTTPKTLSFPLLNFHPEQLAQRSKAVLLFYWLGQKNSYLWVITPARVSCLTLPSAAEINPVVQSYRDAVLNGRDVLDSLNPDGRKLYSMLIEPAKILIPPGSRVILFPDSSLYALNFDTLLVSEPKPHYWIEDVTLTTASSLTLLAAAPVQPAATLGNLLLVGNAAASTPEFPVLRQAEAEMDRVERYFPASQREVLTGAKATPTAFLSSEPGKFAYLHFVTHGTASRAHPLDSAVILSPEGESFKLYARDVVKHHLSAHLVTISACNGAGSRAYSGEGLVGLSWAFLRAGAHNVIGALWEVNDASTPQLMDKLYEELARGQDPASALRAAKLSLLHSDSVYRKPFYWAPFQLYTGS
jgi:CHAT domain-containing protein/Flp pilus assembly protein TadD